MKNFIQGIALAACLFGLASYQNAPNALSGAVVSADKMNVLYIGIDNPINFVANGWANEEISLKVNGAGAMLKKTATGFIVNVNQEGIVQIQILEKKTQIPIAGFNFQSKKIPPPMVRFASKTHSSIQLAEAKNQKRLELYFGDMHIPSESSIEQYTVIRKRKNQDIVQLSSYKTTFDAPVLDILRNLQKGDTLEFSNILIRYLYDGFNPPSLVFEIR
jgi:GldM C-terminal domain